MGLLRKGLPQVHRLHPCSHSQHNPGISVDVHSPLLVAQWPNLDREYIFLEVTLRA